MAGILCSRITGRIVGDSLKEKSNQKNTENLTFHSFTTLLEALGTRCKNRCRINLEGCPSFDNYMEMNKLQKKAFELLNLEP